MKKIILLDNHPNDSRVTIRGDGIVQTLSKQMGTGGNNVPLIMVQNDDEIIRIRPSIVQSGQERSI